MRLLPAAILALALPTAVSAQTTIINNYYGDRTAQSRAPPLNHCFSRVCQYTCATRTWWQASPCPTYTVVIR